MRAAATGTELIVAHQRQAVELGAAKIVPSYGQCSLRCHKPHGLGVVGHGSLFDHRVDVAVRVAPIAEIVDRKTEAVYDLVQDNGARGPDLLLLETRNRCCGDGPAHHQYDRAARLVLPGVPAPSAHTRRVLRHDGIKDDVAVKPSRAVRVVHRHAIHKLRVTSAGLLRRNALLQVD